MLPYAHLSVVFVFFSSRFAFLFVSLSLCEACCMAFGTNASGEGDVAWSMTTLYDPVGM
jgi:hypothetical protein